MAGILRSPAKEEENGCVPGQVRRDQVTAEDADYLWPDFGPGRWQR